MNDGELSQDSGPQNKEANPHAVSNGEICDDPMRPKSTLDDDSAPEVLDALHQSDQ